MEMIETKALKKKLYETYIIDVRENDEYEQGHIKNALNIPLGRLIRDNGSGIPHDKDVVVYCRSGHRSGIAAQFLENIGFRNVKNLYGGYKMWQSAEKGD